MQLLTVHQAPITHQQEVVSYWKLGPQITGGRWYEIFHAAPKSASDNAGFGYVIKLINPELPQKLLRKAIDRLGREAFATERILHPNVVRLLDAELDRAPFFLVQPWIQGRSLDQYLSSLTQFSLSRFLWIIRQIAEAIRAAHDLGRVHLGLDPSHIMLGKTGRVTLLGWSQSNAVSEKAWLPHDQLQLARFTAPECFEEDYRADFASDVYSLGSLIYHCLVLKTPFRGLQVGDIAHAHRHTIPEDLLFAQNLCPPELSQLVKQMMCKHSRNRPTSREVLNRLISIEIQYLADQTMISL